MPHVSTRGSAGLHHFSAPSVQSYREKHRHSPFAGDFARKVEVAATLPARHLRLVSSTVQLYCTSRRRPSPRRRAASHPQPSDRIAPRGAPLGARARHLPRLPTAPGGRSFEVASRFVITSNWRKPAKQVYIGHSATAAWGLSHFAAPGYARIACGRPASPRVAQHVAPLVPAAAD